MSKLFNAIMSEDNIYLAVYCANSGINEPGLLSYQDYNRLQKIRDPFNKETDRMIRKVRKKLEEVLMGDDYFKTKVYLRAKSVEKNEIGDLKAKARPLYTSDLETQIAIISILNLLLYENKEGKLYLSDLAQLIPNNFYGNLPSLEPENLFKPWVKQYKDYSMDVSEYFDRNNSTKKYKYEIKVDLENFFPSINPEIILNYILEKIWFKFKDEKADLEKAITKLLYFDVENENELKAALKGFEKVKIIERHRNVGIPQGLPQSYFFGNLCMVEISKILDKHIPGKSFFYVDDSVIYSNINIIKDKQVMDKINSEIERYEKRYANINNKNYHIKINEDKTECHEVDLLPYKDYVTFINREASMAAVELFKANDEIDDGILLNKFLNLYNSTDNEIKRLRNVIKESKGLKDISLNEFESPNLKEIKSILKGVNIKSDYNISKDIKKIKDMLIYSKDEIKIVQSFKIIIGKINTLKYVIKQLTRTRKFFQYRYLLFKNKIALQYLENHERSNLENIDLTDWNDLSEWEDLIKNFIQCLNTNDHEAINEILKDSIFVTSFNYYLKNINSSEKIHEMRDNIRSFEMRLASLDIDNFDSSVFYLTKNCELYLEAFEKLDKYDKYESIYKSFYRYYKNISIIKQEEKINFLNRLLNQGKNDVNKIDFMKLLDGKKYNLVKQNSEEWWRIVFNTFFSIMFCTKPSDSMTTFTIGKNSMTYYQLRIMLYVRNRIFNKEEFVQTIYNIINDDSMTISIDYGLLEVIQYFKLYAKEPKYIDNLVLIHRYTYEMWKNGSKFMHFYTLHNQEHAVDLIKNSVHFVKAIDYIQVKPIDYYCLFISCYLHDISMVVYPDIDQLFNIKDSENMEILFSDFRAKLYESMYGLSNIYYLKDSDIQMLLLECYKRIDTYFEEYIRSTHPEKSADFIRRPSTIPFIEDTIKDIVAQISQAHGEKFIDVYNISSKAKESLLSIKYCKILLRLADLLDMTKDRITYPLLVNSIEYMPSISAFHWISHYLIESCTIKTDYRQRSSKDGMSYLEKGSIIERVSIEIKVKINNLITTNKINKCKHCYIEDHDIETNTDQSIVLNIAEDKSCKCSMNNCNFVCQWFVLKNQYLFDELFALQQYLNRADNNYKTEFKVKVIMDEKHTIDSKLIDKISEVLKLE